MWFYRSFLGLIIAVMVFLLVQAVYLGDFAAAASHLWEPPWGRLTLVDALAALTMLYLVIAGLEPRWGMRLVWLLAIAATGSAAVALFFLLRTSSLPSDARFKDLLS